MSKYRSGDCLASLAKAGPTLAGLYKKYDKGYGTSFMAVAKETITWIYVWWGFMKIFESCSGQYLFSVQNPWKEVFKNKGDMNPYEIGQEARRRAAKAGSLTLTHMQKKAGDASYVAADATKVDVEEFAGADFGGAASDGIDASSVWKDATAVAEDEEDEEDEDFGAESEADNDDDL